MGIVIVAIPKADDAVWKISSEKIPHLTLLFLGDQPLDNEENVLTFVQFAADTSLTRFGLDVDRRGTLGPDDADVVFFNNERNLAPLKAFRSYLLTNPNIEKAVLSADQFDSWTPHLTLGYPATPAHPDTRDYPGIDWINFDRIAIWVDNFSGPEFQLKPQDDSFYLLQSESDLGKALAHYGVLGMHWGFRRDLGSGGLVTGSPDSAKRNPGAHTAKGGGSSPGAAGSGGGGKSGSKKEEKAIAKVAKKTGQSEDHVRTQINLKKNVNTLSTDQIKELSKRIKTVNEFQKEQASAAAANKSRPKKILAFLKDNAVIGVKKQVGTVIQEQTGLKLSDLGLKTAANKKADKEAGKTTPTGPQGHPNYRQPAGATTVTQEREQAVQELTKAITDGKKG